jgi:hypothetical protein
MYYTALYIQLKFVVEVEVEVEVEVCSVIDS